jgi:hypothetical protein
MNLLEGQRNILNQPRIYTAVVIMAVLFLLLPEYLGL